MSGTPLLRPEFGPTLPELLSGRLRVSRRALTVAAIALLVLIVVAIKVALGIGRATITVHGTPSFSVVYKTALLHKAPAKPGELLHLQGRREHVFVALTARRVQLPPYTGDAIGGLLPVYASTYENQLAAQLPQFTVSDEGRARIGQAMGYDIGYQSGPKRHRTYWREIFLVKDSTKGGGQPIVALRLRQTFNGQTNARDRALVQAVKQAYQSFRFGTRRPLFSPG